MSPRDPFSAIFSGVAAYAEFVGCNYEEAVRLAREGIRQRNEFVGGYRILTAAAAMAGDVELARPPCKSCAAPSPTSPWPGSCANCRSPTKPRASSFWRLCGAPA